MCTPTLTVWSSGPRSQSQRFLTHLRAPRMKPTRMEQFTNKNCRRKDRRDSNVKVVNVAISKRQADPAKPVPNAKWAAAVTLLLALLSPYVHICVTLFVHVPVTVQVFPIRHVETGLLQVHRSVKQMLQVIVEFRETIKAGNTCHLL